MDNVFLKWWLIFCFQLTIVGIAAYFGVFQFVWSHDPSKVALITFGLWIFACCHLGYQTYLYNKESIFPKLNYAYFLSWAFQGLGLVGTTIGFLMMFDSMTAINLQDPNSIKLVMVGLGTCFLTTLIGIISSLSFHWQLVNLEKELDD